MDGQDAASIAGPVVKAALFIDFDNVYISLKMVNPAAAAEFASGPGRWLNWFVNGGHAAQQNDTPPARRSILVRRCYLTPAQFGDYRPFFTRAAFAVVDCPPLTARGKNSADIYMVLDIMDALDHKTRFDEFIILSADADFTPVLLRLRAHDRRTVILANELTVGAYKAACDHVVDMNVFIEEALAVRDLPYRSTSVPCKQQDEILRAVAARVRDRILESGEIAANQLPGIFREFPSFPNSSWFGCQSLRGLAEALVRVNPDLDCGMAGANWSMALRGADGLPLASRLSHIDIADLKQRIIASVHRVLADSPAPILLSDLGTGVIRELGPIVKTTQWAGAQTLKALLLSAHQPDIFVLNVQPGYVYSPLRHQALADKLANEAGDIDLIHDRLRNLPEELSRFIDKMYTVTGAPRLDPKTYAVVFESLLDAAEQDVSNLNELSRAARDLCRDKGTFVNRASVSFVLTGLKYMGVDFENTDLSALDLARTFKENLINLCRNAQMKLSDVEYRLFDEWLAASLQLHAPLPPVAQVPVEAMQ